MNRSIVAAAPIAAPDRDLPANIRSPKLIANFFRTQK